jgi:peroxiredoxin Q/BCP
MNKNFTYLLGSAAIIASFTCGVVPGSTHQKLYAAEVELNKAAPDIELPNQDGKIFKLSDRKGKWTVVYFYPKAGSPGCTEQACAFRDSIKKIEKRDAILVGISADSQESQKEFHSKHNLSFDLLSDSNGVALSAYGVKLPLIGLARRTTFIVGPDLVVRSIAKDVDPAFDAEWSAETLDELQGEASGPAAGVAPSKLTRESMPEEAAPTEKKPEAKPAKTKSSKKKEK